MLPWLLSARLPCHKHRGLTWGEIPTSNRQNRCWPATKPESRPTARENRTRNVVPHALLSPRPVHCVKYLYLLQQDELQLSIEPTALLMREEDGAPGGRALR